MNDIKLYLTAGICILCCILYIIATGVWISVIDNGGTMTQTSLWQFCQETTSSRRCSTIDGQRYLTSCDKLKMRFDATRAFQITTDVFCVASTIVAVARIFVVTWRKGNGRAFFLVLTLASCIASLIGWGAAVSLYVQSFCGNSPTSEQNNARLGSNQPLFIVGWVFNVAVFVLEVATPDDGWNLATTGGEQRAEGDEATTKNNKGRGKMTLQQQQQQQQQIRKNMSPRVVSLRQPYSSVISHHRSPHQSDWRRNIEPTS